MSVLYDTILIMDNNIPVSWSADKIKTTLVESLCTGTHRLNIVVRQVVFLTIIYSSGIVLGLLNMLGQHNTTVQAFAVTYWVCNLVFVYGHCCGVGSELVDLINNKKVKLVELDNTKTSV